MDKMSGYFSEELQNEYYNDEYQQAPSTGSSLYIAEYGSQASATSSYYYPSDQSYSYESFPEYRSNSYQIAPPE
jgi:hypothetical protein